MYDANNFSGNAAMGGVIDGGQSPHGSRGNQGPRRLGAAMRPFTIRQLLNGERFSEGALIVDGREVGHVLLIGKIVYAEAPQMAGASEHINYLITDQTGVIHVKHWVEPHMNPEGGPSLAPAEVGSYVKVSGNVKKWGEKTVVSGTVKPIDNENEITYHFLETIMTHLRCTQGPRDFADPQYGGSNAPTHNFVTPSKMEGGGYTMTPPGAGNSQVANISLEAAISRVIMRNMDHVRSYGMDASEIHAQLVASGRHCTQQEVNKEVRSLVDQGTYYYRDGAGGKIAV